MFSSSLKWAWKENLPHSPVSNSKRDVACKPFLHCLLCNKILFQGPGLEATVDPPVQSVQNLHSVILCRDSQDCVTMEDLGQLSEKWTELNELAGDRIHKKSPIIGCLQGHNLGRRVSSRPGEKIQSLILSKDIHYAFFLFPSFFPDRHLWPLMICQLPCNLTYRVQKSNIRKTL